MDVAKCVGGLLAFACLLSLSGCAANTSAGDSRTAELRANLVLAAEPEGALPIADAKAALASGGTSDAPVVIFGMIDAGKHEPWDQGRAAFLLSDPAGAIGDGAAAHDHNHAGHDHDNCPFCNREKAAAASMAIVQFVDDGGAVIEVDARDLLGVAKGQLVVVQGRGSIDGLGNVLVQASGIYIRE